MMVATTSNDDEVKAKTRRPWALSSVDKFFLVLICLNLGLFEQDLAYHFNILQSTVSRIINT